MKKFLAILGVLFLVLLLAGGVIGFVLWKNPQAIRKVVGGETRLLDYLGAQVIAIANTHLVPELSYETIRYTPDFTLELDGVRLTAPDGTGVLDVGAMTITLGEVPKRGKPIVISQITISEGSVNLIRDASTDGFRGLSPLVEPGDGSASEAESDQPSTALSDVLRLEKIIVRNMSLVYDAGEGEPPMRLDGLTADLDIEPATEAGEGWYKLAFASGREPGLELDMDGRINIETFELDVTRLTANADLDDASATTLPPQLASLVSKHEVRGALTSEISGRVPLLAPEGANLRLNASLTAGRAVFGEYRIPIDRFSLDADMSSSVVTLSSVSLEALGGRLDATGRAELEGDATLSWSVAGMMLREILASRPADQPPKLAGVIQSEGSARFPVADPKLGLSGGGSIAITDGRLLRVPVLGDIAEAADAIGLNGNNPFSDSFQTPFTLGPDGVTMDQFEFKTPALSARGSGLIGFLGTLDLRVNAGPLEAIQDKLGDFGKILGKITDELITYRVRGTVSEPEVKVQPFGAGG